MSEDMFMGYPISLWIELKRRHESGETDKDMVTENIRLRAKVSYYESLLVKAVTYKDQVDGPK